MRDPLRVSAAVEDEHPQAGPDEGQKQQRAEALERSFLSGCSGLDDLREAQKVKNDAGRAVHAVREVGDAVDVSFYGTFQLHHRIKARRLLLSRVVSHLPEEIRVDPLVEAEIVIGQKLRGSLRKPDRIKEFSVLFVGRNVVQIEVVDFRPRVEQVAEFPPLRRGAGRAVRREAGRHADPDHEDREDRGHDVFLGKELVFRPRLHHEAEHHARQNERKHERCHLCPNEEREDNEQHGR